LVLEKIFIKRLISPTSR